MYQDDEEFDVRSANASPMRIYVREILDNAPMDLEMGLVTRHKVSLSSPSERTICTGCGNSIGAPSTS